MTRTFIFFSLILYLSSIFSTAGAQQFPELNGRVVDGAKVIAPGDAQAITNAAAEHEARTSNQLVVVTVPSLQGLAIRDYGYRLGHHWGIGKKGKNNGVLLLVAPTERKVAIEVGYGLEGTFTDAVSKRIIEEFILPEFRAGRMSDGVRKGSEAILKVPDGCPFTPDASDGSTTALIVVSSLMLILISGILIYCIVRLFYCKGSVPTFALILAAEVYVNGVSTSTGKPMPRSSGGFGGFGGFGGGGSSFGGGGSSGGW